MTQPKATHRATFNVAIDYNVVSGQPDTQHLGFDLRDIIEHSIKQHALDNLDGAHFHAYSCEVAPLGGMIAIDGAAANLAKPTTSGADTYSDCEVDAALCVFDELIGMVSWVNNKRKFKQSDASEDMKAFAQYVEALRDDLGTPHLRTLSTELGRVIETIWRELEDLKLTEHWDGAWDFEFVPDVLFTAWLNGKEFPDASNRTQWLAASLSALGYSSEHIRGAQLENLLRGKPNAVNDIRAAAKHFSDAVRAVGAGELTEYLHQSSSNIEEELTDLAALLDFLP